MSLTNPWIGYFDRTYDQIKSGTLTLLGINVPEITDHNDTNPWVKGISIWGGLMEMIGYYVDNNAREAYITTAREYASAVKLAKFYDYRVQGCVPASVSVRFTSNIPASANITIPAGTIVQTSAGLIFATVSSATIIAGNTFIDVAVKQWEKVTARSLGNSNGAADQVFVLEADVVDGSVEFFVNGVEWTEVDTLALSFSTDQVFVAGLNEDQNMTVLCGDGVNGAIPGNALPLTVNYYTSQGQDGNIGAGQINTITSVITVPGSEILSVTNILNASGGADSESLALLAKRIPYSIRTRYRAVTEDDFQMVTELFAGVQSAGIFFNCDIDRYVHIYLVPEGGGLASPALISDVNTFLLTRKIVGTLIQVGSSGVIRLKINVNVNAIPGFSNDTVSTNVIAALVAFGAADNQEVRGQAVLGDIYQAMEAASGVLNTDISMIVAIPYPRNLTTPANSLNWTPVIQPDSTIIQYWLIRFTTNSQFDFFKGTDFVGNFHVDTLIIQDEIQFTINGAHASGDSYEFYTYPYNRSVILQEASVIFIDPSDLVVNVIGGV